jgi:DGQHR domain-containing protein
MVPIKQDTEKTMTISKAQAKEMTQYYSLMKGSSDLPIIAIEGNEGDRTTYVAKISFSELSEHFKLVPTNNAPQSVTLQRELATSRGKGISKYIQSNSDFIFPELIAVVERLDTLRTEISSVVRLVLCADAFRYLVDGQGRLFGVNDVMALGDEYANMSVDIKFVTSRGVDADAQIFTDVNKTPVSPNASQCIAMDTRQSLSKFAKEAVMSNSYLRNRIDFSKASVTGNTQSTAVWTLNQFSKFIQILTGCTAKTAETLFADEDKRTYWISFIEKLFTHLRVNEQIASTLDKGCGQWNENSIVTTSVFLKSVALYGKVILMNFAAGTIKDWSFMDALCDMDFSTNEKEWVGRCLNYRGRFEDKSFNHKAMASYLCLLTGLDVPEELETVEEEVLLARVSIMQQQRKDAKEQATAQCTEQYEDVVAA